MPAAYAANEDLEPLNAVFYDSGDARRSVAVVGSTILQDDDYYRGYRVVTFTPDAVIFKRQEDGSGLNWPLNPENLNPSIHKLARHYFIVGQLRAVHLAQLQYEQQFKNGYAADIETLIRHGYLADGFESGVKQDYYFQMADRPQEYGKEPTFLATASPVAAEEDYYFSVDQLGQVRYADTPSQMTWGPVWDYRHHSTNPASRSIGLAQ